MMFLRRLKGKSDIPPGEVTRFMHEMAWENLGSEMLISAMLLCSYLFTFAWVEWHEGLTASLADVLPWLEPSVFCLLALVPPLLVMACSWHARRKEQGRLTFVVHRFNLFLLVVGSCLPSILVGDHLFHDMVILLVSVLVTQSPKVSLILYGGAMVLILAGVNGVGGWHDRAYLDISDVVISTVLGLVMVRIRYSDRIRHFLITSSMDAQHKQLKAVNQELVKANAHLNNLSRMDGLTGVNNRRAFDDILDREWRRAMRTGASLGLLMIDIDYFKPFNDTYGHQAGDECLKQVAAALRATARRGGDMVARYGGEEFAVILPCEDEHSLKATAEVIRQKVAELGIAHKTPDWGHVSISLGGAIMCPQPDEEPDLLVAQADGALYNAKAGGRNRAVVMGESGVGAA